MPNRKVDRASVLYNMMFLIFVFVVRSVSVSGFGPWEKWSDLLLLLVIGRREEEMYQLLEVGAGKTTLL